MCTHTHTHFNCSLENPDILVQYDKKYSITQIITEIHTGTTMKQNLTLVRMAIEEGGGGNNKKT